MVEEAFHQDLNFSMFGIVSRVTRCGSALAAAHSAATSTLYRSSFPSGMFHRFYATEPPEQSPPTGNDLSAAVLMMAARDGDHATAKSLLENGVDANQTTPDTLSPLFVAASKGHEDVVHVLLTGGADVNMRVTEVGVTPLYIACDQGHAGVVRTLISAGDADVNLPRTDVGTFIKKHSSILLLSTTPPLPHLTLLLLLLLLMRGLSLSLSHRHCTPVHLRLSRCHPALHCRAKGARNDCYSAAPRGEGRGGPSEERQRYHTAPHCGRKGV